MDEKNELVPRLEKQGSHLINTGDVMLQTLLNPAVFEQMQRSAGLFSKSGLVPETFRDNMPACFVGLQLAAQLGVNPFMLFQKIYAIKGKIGIEAQVAIAVANQKRIFKGPMEYSFSGEGKTRACTCSNVMSANGKTVELSLSWSEVHAEGWDAKAGSKWLTIPDKMFRYRTALWLIRTYAPEVLLGLNSIDELEDTTIIDVTPTRREPVETMAEKIKKAKNNGDSESLLPIVEKIIAEKKSTETPLKDEPAPLVGQTPSEEKESASELAEARLAVRKINPPLLARIKGRLKIKKMNDCLTFDDCLNILGKVAVLEAEEEIEEERGF